MTTVPINYWAVLVAGLANIVLGWIWYGPLFGKTWTRLSGMTAEKMQQMQKRGMALPLILAYIGALLMAFVLEHALVFAESYLGVAGISAGMMAAFWNWLGFMVPVLLGMVLWEGKSWRLWLIHAAYYLLALLIMATILVSWI